MLIRIPANPIKYPFHNLRAILAHPLSWAFFFLGPALDIFRVDVIGQRLIFLGEHYPFEFQYLMWLPIVFYAGVIGIGLTSFLFGRIFCGWVCPHNILTEWTRPFRAAFGREPYPLWLKPLFKKQPALEMLWKVTSPFIAIAIGAALSFLFAFYLVPPEWVMAQYNSGDPHIALTFGQGLFTFLGVFLLYCGHDFCRTCCPYGMAQSISAYHSAAKHGKWAPMEIRFQGQSIESDCKSCKACATACPVDVDPRKPEALKVGQFDGCFNCGVCIDACNLVHETRNTSGILAFHIPIAHTLTGRSAESNR